MPPLPSPALFDNAAKSCYNDSMHHILWKLKEKIRTKGEITALLMLKNRKILRRFTAQVVKTMSYLSFPVMVVMCAITCLPVKFMNTLKFKAVSFGAFIAFAALAVLFRFFEKTATKISMFLSYVMFSCLFAFALLLSYAPEVPQPYSTMVGFLIIMPIIITDKRWRVNLFNVVICAVSLVLSYFLKARNFFLSDCMNCTIFMLVGIIIGDYTLINQLNYIDLREGKLDRDLEVLKAKSEAKTAFLTNMSHEIRTPINSILGFNEMTLRECKDENIIRYAKNIDVSGRTLLSLVNDILDFSRIEAGKLDIVNADYALDSMISDVVSIILPRAEEKKLTFKVNVDPKIPNALVGDERRIKQCALNLLTNAVKYTHKGSVEMDVLFEKYSEDEIFLTITVTDTGIGIKPENINKMFEAFERIEERRNRDIEGTGLGMKIVQQLLGKMGTYLDVQSEYGKGSRFSFSVEQHVANEAEIGDFTERYKQTLSKHENYIEKFTAPNAHLLVVDDVEINLTVVKSLLKNTLVKIECATSGRQAIDLVRQTKYDVIFLDHRMPDLDGVETFQMMKAMKDNLNKDVPVIALTANAIAGAREMFLKVGFKDYITKPIDASLMEKMLIKYLPQNLVHITKREKEASISSAAQSAHGTSFLSDYRLVEGADADEALKNCGDEETFKSVVHNYYKDIESNAKKIEQFADSWDIKNYTVKVHALKSSSRLVGIMELSKMAEHLEECGDKVLKGETNAGEEIKTKTPALLSLYRSYKKRLESVVPKENNEKDGANGTAKKVMSCDDAKNALLSLRECAEAYDFESADRILEMIKKYDIPKDKKEIFDKVETAIRNADTKAVMEATNGQ